MIIDTRHPEYVKNYQKWLKYRLTYEGGEEFITTYLRRLSNLEKTEDFLDRKAMAYCPSFASTALQHVNDAIHERLPDVQRVGGTPTYIKAMKSDVDLQGSSMNTFMGLMVLPELLVQAKVGILVDNHADLGTTLADKGDKHPFLTVYQTENILSWAPNNPIEGYTALLLREVVQTTTIDGLPDGEVTRYRYMKKVQGGVLVEFYDESGNLISTTVLQLEEIPFVVLKISQSLLRDAADYQIALLNVESSDISYIRKANYPLYYEFYDPKTENPYLKGPEHKDGGDKTIKVGLSQGRRLPQGLDAPGFIGPDPEILRISMEKGKQLKEDIQRLVNLSISSIPKGPNDRSLESGLSAIGQVLQTGETQIAKFWNAFEGSEIEFSVTYPTVYTIKSDVERLDEIEKLDKIADRVPSDKYKRAVRKRMARTLLGGSLLDSELKQIDTEIDEAAVVSSNPNIILSAQKAGLLDDITAADALGFDGEKVVPLAKKDRAERIRLAQEAQGGLENASPARGMPEMDKGQRTSNQEKQDKQQRGQQDNAAP